MIESLTDWNEFRRRRESAWKRNVEYWLSEPLRHVTDVGAYITNRIYELCVAKKERSATILDMGFGSAWLLESLLATELKFSYAGLDGTEEFVDRATRLFSKTTAARFFLGDLETDLTLPIMADVVVNAFNFFELCDLPQAMHNVKKHLRPGGHLFMSTIDKTYLLLALSKNWPEFHENLRRYQELPGTKYAFQPIDVGTHLSDVLEYPSVLYSTQDFVDVAESEGLKLISYTEHAFTARAVPKIYCHLEFQNCESSCPHDTGSDG